MSDKVEPPPLCQTLFHSRRQSKRRLSEIAHLSRTRTVGMRRLGRYWHEVTLGREMDTKLYLTTAAIVAILYGLGLFLIAGDLVILYRPFDRRRGIMRYPVQRIFGRPWKMLARGHIPYI